MVPQPQPSPFRGRLLFRSLVPILLVLSLAPISSGQPGPRILHDELKCVRAGEYLVLQAFIEPADGLITVKAYFRANLYSQFYYVEMTREGDLFQGVLPKASNEITGIHYYLEAVDESYNSVRTAEYTPQVVTSEANCREENPTPATYLDGPGAITIGATGPGPGIPAGFLPEGIIGTITAAGRVASGGGGSGLILGVAGAGAAAAGIGVLVSGNSDDTTTTTTPGTGGGGGTTTISTTTVPVATTSVPSSMIDACFETSPSPPTIPVGGAVRFDASCSLPERELIASYLWRFNDGRSNRDGRVVNRTYPTAGVFRADLTITDINGVSDTTSMDVTVDEALPPPPGGGGGSGKTVKISKSGPGSASVGNQFSWNITVTNTGSSVATGITMTDNLPGGLTADDVTFTAGTCSGAGTGTVSCTANLNPGQAFTITIKVTPTAPGSLNNRANLTVASPPESSSSGQRTNVNPLQATPGAPTRLTTRFTSQLELPPGDGSTRAQVVLNGARTDTTDNSQPFLHDVSGSSGENTIDATLLSAPQGDGLWRFDFRNAPHFEASSFVVESGQVVVHQPRQLVFRVTSGVRRVRFKYRLSSEP